MLLNHRSSQKLISLQEFFLDGLKITIYDNIIQFYKKELQMANAKVAKNGFDFDRLPVIAQFIIGLVALAVIVAAGFAVFFLVDIILLDADPIGNGVAAIARALKS